MSILCACMHLAIVFYSPYAYSVPYRCEHYTILQFFCNSSLFIEYIIYDDACHLKRYACNPSRANETDTTKHISCSHIVVDRFHFPGHVDLWCKEHCNPNKLEELNNVKLCII